MLANVAHDVFLSYSSKDKAAADAACAVLERNGVRVWMAPRDILPGVGWAQSIIGAINGARVMVLVYSSSANASHQIEREVERAINKGIPVVPFRVEDVQPSATLEYFISETHWLDAFTPPLEHHLERLADAVKRLLASEFVQPTQPEVRPARRRARPEEGEGTGEVETAEAPPRPAAREEPRKTEQAAPEKPAAAAVEGLPATTPSPRDAAATAAPEEDRAAKPTVALRLGRLRDPDHRRGLGVPA